MNKNVRLYSQCLPCNWRWINALMPWSSVPFIFTCSMGLSSPPFSSYVWIWPLLFESVSLTFSKLKKPNLFFFAFYYKDSIAVLSRLHTWVTCISFFTTSLPSMWSNTVCKNVSLIIDNLSLSRCQMSSRDSSIAIIDTYKMHTEKLQIKSALNRFGDIFFSDLSHKWPCICMCSVCVCLVFIDVTFWIVSVPETTTIAEKKLRRSKPKRRNKVRLCVVFVRISFGSELQLKWIHSNGFKYFQKKNFTSYLRE